MFICCVKISIATTCKVNLHPEINNYPIKLTALPSWKAALRCQFPPEAILRITFHNHFLSFEDSVVFSTERLEALFNGSISLYRGDVDIVCVCVCLWERKSMLSSLHKFLFGCDCSSGPENFSCFTSDISIFRTEKLYFLCISSNCLRTMSSHWKYPGSAMQRKWNIEVL